MASCFKPISDINIYDLLRKGLSETRGCFEFLCKMTDLVKYGEWNPGEEGLVVLFRLLRVTNYMGYKYLRELHSLGVVTVIKLIERVGEKPGNRIIVHFNPQALTELKVDMETGCFIQTRSRKWIIRYVSYRLSTPRSKSSGLSTAAGLRIPVDYQTLKSPIYNPVKEDKKIIIGYKNGIGKLGGLEMEPHTPIGLDLITELEVKRLNKRIRTNCGEFAPPQLLINLMRHHTIGEIENVIDLMVKFPIKKTLAGYLIYFLNPNNNKKAMNYTDHWRREADVRLRGKSSRFWKNYQPLNDFYKQLRV